jgi:hypothetical protein
MLDVEIINAWKRRGVREDDDDYEGRMNLVPPNNVATAVEHENQRAASPTMLLPMSANKEAACTAGTLCQAPDHANINSSMHCCLNCRGKIHSAMWCGKNRGNYIMSVGGPVLGCILLFALLLRLAPDCHSSYLPITRNMAYY